ncbi:MAG: 3-phosphoshikimate 1-carboxyvinyltransferase [Rhodospirillales bacterium]
MSTSLPPTPARSARAKPLSGKVRVPGDKSISHRALMFGALGLGETRVSGLLTGEDVLRTAAAMATLGAEVQAPAEPGGDWLVAGRGVGGLMEPADVLDMGNSGTAARLLLGLLATHPLTAVMTGDASLRSRPMKRVITPLERFGARFMNRDGGRLPLCITGTTDAIPQVYESPVASAQVKSAVLLAGLNTSGETVVIEEKLTRDHTERMLRHFGAEVRTERTEDGRFLAAVRGEADLRAADVIVPGDVSSAAFPLAAALIVPGSEVTIEGIGLNPARNGLIETLRDMGADITQSGERVEGGEPVADLRVRQTPLKGITVPADRAPSMIDEYPILSVAAAFADGVTRFEGVEELRVKESDRIALMVEGLKAAGVVCDDGPDWMSVTGAKRVKGGITARVSLDHRIAMSFLVLGMASDESIAVDDAAAIATSFPGFMDLMNGLGADMKGDLVQ